MRLFSALFETHKNTGYLAAKLNGETYYLNAYGGRVEDGYFDLRAGIGGWGEHILTDRQLDSEEFEAIIDLPKGMKVSSEEKEDE